MEKLNYMKQDIENIIKKNLPMKYELSDENYDLKQIHISYNDAIDDIDTSLIADEVLKVVEKTYDHIFKWLLGENGDFPESEPGKRYNFRTELRKRLQLLSNLSTNKENKNND